MTLDDFLSRLDEVKRHNARWSAKCPAHADRSPSLSVMEGGKGILLRCWAGCTLNEICHSLGIEQKDLFYDAGLPRSQRLALKTPRLNLIARAFNFELAGFDLRSRARHILMVAKGFDVSTLREAEFDRALACIERAYADQARAELFEHVADTLRQRDFAERKAHEHTGAA